MEAYERYREAFQKGRNVMRLARRRGRGSKNSSEAILLAYDLQAGSYLQAYQQNPEKYEKIYRQIAAFILQGLSAHARKPFSLLEVGVGDGTTLRGVLSHLGIKVRENLGFDLSWSRIKVARDWLANVQPTTCLFVGTLFHMPLPSNSVDVVYSNHSLEPNGGREKEALRECLRVARRCVVLIEPCYEKAGPVARRRMNYHGYVKNLVGNAKKLGAKIILHQLLSEPLNPLNPSGVLILKKNVRDQNRQAKLRLVCPTTRTVLKKNQSFLWSEKAKLAYPIFRGIPLLRPENAIIATRN